MTRSKPVIPRSLAGRDVDEAVAHYLTEAGDLARIELGHAYRVSGKFGRATTALDGASRTAIGYKTQI